MAERLFSNRDGLRAFLKANDKELCERCGCCELVCESCEQCDGDGIYGHDCGEDTCCCLDQDENKTCDLCFGRGWFSSCLGNCGENGHTREDDSEDATA